MNKLLVVLITSLLLISPSLIAGMSEPSRSIQETTISYGKRYNIQGWVYVQIQGAPYERGYQYGYLLAEEIIDMMTRWSNMIHNHPSLKPLNNILEQQQYDAISERWWEFCKQTATRMYWDEYPQEYKDEIQGIAAGITERGFTFHGKPVTYQDILASNSMYEMLSKLTDQKIRKGIHPLFTLYDLIKPDIPKDATVSAEEFVTSFYPDPFAPVHHHCSSFIATGNATTDGEIIIANSMWSSEDGAGMWWWSYYIAIRWNILLDVIPTQGYRFQMSCAPGYIWSDHDFYQNNAGIMFIETTLPQGIWKEDGLPLAIRARRAVQYADSIENVINFLRTDNDGVMNAVWLIGDTKTGEIARYELGLYHDAIVQRTTNGFAWSSNNPLDFWVRWEKMDWKLLIQRYVYYFILGSASYQYYTPWYLPASRDIAFEELGNKYYGDIDVEVVKEIMSLDPIGTHSPDCKITSSSLVENNGMWLFTGNPGGKTLNMSLFDSPTVDVEKVLPVGWVRVYGLPAEHSYTPPLTNSGQNDAVVVKWMTPTNHQRNDITSQSIIVDDVMYSTSNDGNLYAIDTEKGNILWNKTIGSLPTRPLYVNHSLYVGTHEGLKKIDVEWLQLGEKPISPVVCPPTSENDTMFVGSKSGMLYAYALDNGAKQWEVDLGCEVWVSDPEKGVIVAGAGTVIYAIDSATGEILWARETDGIITAQPAIDNDVVYVGSWDSYLYCFNLTDGTKLWDAQTGWGVETTAVTDNNTVYFGSHDGIMYALDKDTGDVQWSFQCDAGIHSSPTLTEGYVIFGSDDGYLYCVNADSGTIKWSFAPGRSITDHQENYFTTAIRSNTVIQDDVVFFGVTGVFYGLYLS
jgi:outer membrane protein assembly factor BamB